MAKFAAKYLRADYGTCLEKGCLHGVSKDLFIQDRRWSRHEVEHVCNINVMDLDSCFVLQGKF